jgi:hypothetical protein
MIVVLQIAAEAVYVVAPVLSCSLMGVLVVPVKPVVGGLVTVSAIRVEAVSAPVSRFVQTLLLLIPIAAAVIGVAGSVLPIISFHSFRFCFSTFLTGFSGRGLPEQD